MRKKALAIACLCSSGLAQASDLEWAHTGVRPLGMGNAFVAQADDFNALYYNPAGLAWLDDWTFEIISLRTEVSTNTLDAVSDVQELTDSGSGSTEATISLIQKQGGKPLGFALGLEPYFVMPHFGFALALDLLAKVTFHNDITFDVRTGPRLTLPIGYATTFFRDRLALGFNYKIVAEAGVDKTFDIDSIETLTNGQEGEGSLADYVAGGYGQGVDLGLLFRPDLAVPVTFGLSIMDFGGTSFTKASVGGGTAVGTPDTRPPSVNTGVSYKPFKTESQYVTVNADVVAINQPVHYSKKVNFGTEYGLGKFLKIQGGLHQGEWTAGVQLDLMLLRLRLASYAEQLGTAAGQDELLTDRRYALHLNLLL